MKYRVKLGHYFEHEGQSLGEYSEVEIDGPLSKQDADRLDLVGDIENENQSAAEAAKEP